ncbi:putative repeat protein (TIGR02543 family) [Klugiella xanthotipulae]|uniref:Putative repeat protein (TIGR02543 family) n=1 Tax=Klugiella xanthotipulae TaxID=244735 RepID=A0A543I665_9MICO|nr:putative repeat protein (TIGR02543 family) [Klugiella xanthotipulae]
MRADNIVVRQIFLAATAFIVMIVGIVVPGHAARAASSVTVNTVAELQSAVSGAVEDTTITLGNSFPQTLPGAVTLNLAAPVAVRIDGSGMTLYPAATGRHLTVTTSGSSSLRLENLTFALPAGSTATNGGVYVTQQGTSTVALSDLDFVGLKTTALGFGGSGTGKLSLTRSSFVGNSASSAAALLYGRGSAVAATTMSGLTFEANRGLSGAGYSGGAMRVDAGAQGSLLIEDSLFLNNTFVDGGSQPRGGAIALHNASVQLTLNRDYFRGNSTASSSKPGSADGGAVSVFNSTPGSNGSLRVSDSVFEANQAQDDGAAIFLEGRAATQAEKFPTQLVVENSTFSKNVSGDAGGFDTGGVIQASLRVEASVTNNTFLTNTKAGGRGGIDLGAHSATEATYGAQSPKGTVVNNIFTAAKSVDVGTWGCGTNVGCAADTVTVTTAQEPQLLLDVFGTANPALDSNRTTRSAGDPRPGKTTEILGTVAIAPPLSATSYTAYQFAAVGSTPTADERGIAHRTAPALPDAGSLAMDYVRFDAQTNGGSWSGLTSLFPHLGGRYLGDPEASQGWYEVRDPGTAVPLPTVDPTAPGGTEFVGWFTAPTGGTAVTAAPAAQGQTLYAQFVPFPTFTVTFDSAGGSAVAAVADLASGDLVAEPTAPIRDGFTFDGWVRAGEAYDFSTPVTSNITLVAAWTPVPPLTTIELSVEDVVQVYGQVKAIHLSVSGVSSGWINVTLGERSLGGVPVVDGAAVIQPDGTSPLAVGSYAIYASYFSSETPLRTASVVGAEGTFTVNPAETQTTLSVEQTKGGGTVSLQGSVTAEYDTVPTGSVRVRVAGREASLLLPLDEHGHYGGEMALPEGYAGTRLVLSSEYVNDADHLASTARAELAVPVRGGAGGGTGTVLATTGASDPAGYAILLVSLGSLLLVVTAATRRRMRR